MAKKPKVKRVVIDANGNVSDYKGSNMEQRVNTATQQRQAQQRQAQQRRELTTSPAKVANNRRLSDIRTVDTVNNFDNVTEKRNKELSKDPKKNTNPLLTVGKTLGNIATNMGEGAIRTGEGVLDFTNDVGDAINNFLTYQGNKLAYGKKRADQVLKEDQKAQEKFLKRNLTKEFQDTTGFSDVKKDWEKDSLVKSSNTAGQVAQGVGGMVPSLLAGQYLGFAPELASTKGLSGAQKAATIAKNVGKTYVGQLPANAILGAQSYGGGLEEALNEGATRNQARLYGLANAGIEQGTEMITGGVPGLQGKGSLDNIAENLIDRNSKEFANAGLKYLYSSAGEGLEEYLGAMADPLAKQIYSNEPIDWNKTREEARQAALTGALTGAILNSPSAMQDVQQASIDRNQRLQQEELQRQENERQRQEEIKKRQEEERKAEQEAKKKQEEAQIQAQEQQKQAVEPQKEQPRPVATQTQNQAQNEVIDTKKQEVQNHVEQIGERNDWVGKNLSKEKQQEIMDSVYDEKLSTEENNRKYDEEIYKREWQQPQEKENKRILNGRDYSKYTNLSDEDIQKLDNLYTKHKNKEKLTKQEQQDMQYLRRKQNGVKFPELSKSNSFEDIKSEYGKYYTNANMDKFDSTILDKAKEVVPTNKQGKRTKQGWLDLAENIGIQARNMDAESLKKYAYESFKEARPNVKENLNRQGNKYVDFGINEWINKVYDGAGVGKQQTETQPVEVNKRESMENELKRMDQKGFVSRNMTKEQQQEMLDKIYDENLSEKELNEKLGDEVQKTIVRKKLIEGLEESAKENNEEDFWDDVDRHYHKGNMPDFDITRKDIQEIWDKNNTKRVELASKKDDSEQVLKIDEEGNATTLDGRPEILDEVPKEHTPAFEKVKNAWKSFRHHFTDHRAVIYDLSREYKNPKLYHEADALDTVNGKAQVDIGRNQVDTNGRTYKNFIDEEGNKVSMSFEKAYDLYKKIPNKAKNEFLVNNLNLDRLKQGVEQFENMDEAYSEGVLAELREKYPDIDKWAENIYQYNRNLAQKMVDSGRISQKLANTWQKLTPHYVRIQRDMGNNKNSGVSTNNGKVSSENLIRTVKGSALPILPIKETTAQYTIDAMEAMQYNNFGKELVKTIGVGSVDGNAEDTLDMDEMFGTDKSILDKDGKGNYSLTIYDKGVPVSVPINEAIYESLKKRDLRKVPVLSQMSKVQRELLTNKNPYFGFATNPVKDFQDMFLYSKFSAARNLKTYSQLFGGRTLGKAKNKVLGTPDGVSTKDWVDLYYNRGNAANSYYEKGEFKKKSGIVGKVVKAPLNAIEAGNNFLESMPRITEFVNTIQKAGYTINTSEEGPVLVPRKGKTPKKSVEQVLAEADYNAADVTTNFKRGGTWAKNLDRNGATFFSPSVQGAAKFGRTFTEAIGDAKRGDFSGAMRLFARAAALGVAPSLLARAMYGGDDDEYEELQDYQKDRYYLFKQDDGTILRIPKGRALSLFQSMTRRSVDASKGKKDAFKGFGQLVENQIAPNDPFENNVLAPWTAVKRNESWSGNKIVSDFLNENYNPEDQYDAKTSEFSKWAGKKLKDVPLENAPFFGAYLETIKSPKKLDYLIDQYSGVIGDIALPNMTNYAENENGSGLNIIGNPLKSKFKADPIMSSKLVNDYYTLKSKTIKDSNGENATNLQKAKNQYIAGKYSDVSTHISSLYAEQRDIQNSKTLSDAEKYKQNREKQKEINDYMREVMNNVNNAKEENGVVKIGEKSYVPGKTSYGKDTMKEISSKKLDAAKSVGLSIGEYSKVDSHIGDLQADKDENGKTINGTKKKKAISYLRDSGYSNDKIKAIVEAYGWKFKEGD